MKRIAAAIGICACMLGLFGCSRSDTVSDYPAAIMVDGEIYVLTVESLPAEVDDSEVMGYTTSYTDTFPQKDGETNFNRELDMPYAKVEGGIAVWYGEEWRLCIPEADTKK